MLKSMKPARHASFEMPGNLLYALLIAVLIIAFYMTTVEFTKKESEKIYGTQGNAAAYVSLKKACLNWVSYINLCPACDCTNCEDSFLQELSIFSAYYVPYYVSASKLVLYDGTTETFGPNPDLSYADSGGDCPANGCTIKCAEALAVIGVSPETGDFMGEIKKALNPVIDKNDPDKAQLEAAVKTRRKALRDEYAKPCAQVCLWVAGRAQECALGSETCAKSLPGEYQKLP